MKSLKVIGFILRSIVALLFFIIAINVMAVACWYLITLDFLEFIPYFGLKILGIVFAFGVTVFLALFLFLVWAWMIPIDTKKVIAFFFQD
ncbi:hypothetical protein [Lactococcus lactis]|uniref:hypothetical protein n=1 Tax=Lactococcus lactis TaxID=1358 RepID=UPI00223A9CB6|nr:hypothetical protein [Lactococcus lactis]MCT0448931.1 hypothetical protein [Lactococcus lactis subsp. lactis]